jgi:predicted RNase H-like nuclease (RuvC/YqgF family)
LEVDLVFHRFRQHGAGIVALLLVAAAAFPAAAITSSTPGSSASTAAHPAAANESLDSELGALTNLYANYEAKLTELKARLEADTKELDALAHRKAEIERSHPGSWPPDVQAEVTAIDQKILILQERIDRTSDEIKALNLALAQLFDILTQTMRASDKILRDISQKIGR